MEKKKSPIIVVNKELLNSRAWCSLRKGSSAVVYTHFLMKRVMEKLPRKKGKDSLFIKNNGKIEFTYSEARKRLAEVLDLAENDEVVIKRRNGEAFSLRRIKKAASPLDIDGLKLNFSTTDLIAAVRESRER